MWERNRDKQIFFDRGLLASTHETELSVEGTVERIIYENADTGFLVGRLRRNEGELISFVGRFLAVSPGDTMRLWGHWQDDPRFGRQLRVARFETVLPSTIEAMERYLGSGLIQGVGEELAHRIVKAFGTDTLRVIEEEPEKLRKVRGIGKKRAAQIRQAWEAQRAIQSIMMFLQGHGIPVGRAVKIYKRYGNAAVTALRENPYRLIDDIPGTGFKTADAIAAELGVPKDAPIRAEAGLQYVLEQATADGHVFLPWEELRVQAASLLEIEPATIEEALVGAVARKNLVRDSDGVYLPYLFRAELGISRLLCRLLTSPRQEVPIRVEKAIEWVERTKGIQLSEEQRQAIRTAISSKVMVITGGPGTGKTTVLDGLLSIFEKKGLSVVLAAPTGRAAKRMECATGRASKTIHRLLEFSPKTGQFTRNDSRPLRADIVVIDECSMVDTSLMHHLLEAVPPFARLILVGDVDQLPSVGPGNVLLDIISSEVVPVVWLRTVFRQAAKSGIVSNAHRINQGNRPVFNDKDFFFVERPQPQEALDTVLELVTVRMPRKFQLDPKRDIQVLAPMHRGAAGVTALNEALQKALNPEGKRLGGYNFGLYDKVMQQRNNYELEVFNGDVGVVTQVDAELNQIEVQFDDRTVNYPFDALDELALAYASTVHKAQGSEYPAVVLSLLKEHHLMLQRNVLYTAITRASRLVVIIGDPKAIAIAVNNTRVTRRNTRLAERLRTA